MESIKVPDFIENAYEISMKKIEKVCKKKARKKAIKKFFKKNLAFK